MVSKKKSAAMGIFNTLKAILPSEELKRLLEWAEVLEIVTHNSPATCVLRAIATRALRFRTTIREVTAQIFRSKSVDIILPERF